MCLYLHVDNYGSPFAQPGFSRKPGFLNSCANNLPKFEISVFNSEGLHQYNPPLSESVHTIDVLYIPR